MDAGLRHQHLEGLDDVGGPGPRLMRVVHREDGLLGKGGDPIGELGVPDPLRTLAGGLESLDHLGGPPGGLLFGDPARALALDAEQALDRGGPEPLGDLELDERHDRHLVLAEPVVGQRFRHADRLADHGEQLERDPGSVADLSERLGRETGEPLVAGRVHEVERERTISDRAAHAVERDPGVLERSGHQHAAHVARRESIGLAGRQDAELHQPGEVRRRRRRLARRRPVRHTRSRGHPRRRVHGTQGVVRR